MYKRNIVNEDLKLRLSKIVRRIDGATLLFSSESFWLSTHCGVVVY